MNKTERGKLISQLIKYSTCKQEDLEEMNDSELIGLLSDVLACETAVASATGERGPDESDLIEAKNVDREVVDYLEMFDPSAFVVGSDGRKFIKLNDMYDLFYKKFGFKAVKSHVVQAPSRQNGMVACVEVEIETFDGRVVRCCADAYQGNVHDFYGKFPTAMAEARALSRALIKLMNLRITAIEETDRESVDYNNEPISSQQIVLIENLLKRVGKSWDEVKDVLGYDDYDTVQSLTKDCKHKDAIIISKYLNDMRKKKKG